MLHMIALRFAIIRSKQVSEFSLSFVASLMVLSRSEFCIILTNFYYCYDLVCQQLNSKG